MSRPSWLVAPFALFAGAFLGASLQDPEPGLGAAPLDVRELRIVDEGGTPRVVLSVDEDGNGRIEVLGPEGRPAHFLGFDKGAALYDLHGAERRPRVRLTVDSQGAGAVSTFNGEGAPAVELGGTSGGDGGVRVTNGPGTRAFYLGDDLRGNGVVDGDAKPGKRVLD